MAEFNFEKMCCNVYENVKKRLIEEDGWVFPNWHDMKTDPPKEDGTYLVCRYPFYHPEGEVTTSNYALNLRKVDDLDFEEERPGWWYYDDEWGFKEEGPFDYWMPLPKPPKKEEEDGNSSN